MMNELTDHAAGASPARVFVLHIDVKTRAGRADDLERTPETRLEEALGLARAIEVEIVGQDIASITRVHPSTYLGSGKVDSLELEIRSREAGLVIVNAQLSPGQQRNLEKRWGAKVLDRTGLILEIFGRRAATREGTLQVELAHLQYQKTRLVRSWTHLERQRGGSGFLGGPGETQLESDRRAIQERISRIEKQLEAVIRTRTLHRKAREKVPYPTVALVGYTNAGKSTLFNRLTSAQVLAEDKLFATLDPTMRQVVLPHGRRVILSDTVGFISDLPTTLVAAFKATLEEVLQADIIVHVRDVSHPQADAQRADVIAVLTELGLDEASLDNMVEVMNKADLLDGAQRRQLQARAARGEGGVAVSALTGTGCPELLQSLEERLARAGAVCEITLSPEDGKDVSWIYERAEVLRRRDFDDGHIRLSARFDPAALGLAQRRFGGRLLPLDERAGLVAAQ